jgi:serine/threonine-protein kinase
MNQSRPNGMHACLDQSVLKAYDQGTIPEAQLERVAGHLAICPNCESVLEAVRGGEDAFMHNLRYYLRAAPPMPADEGRETGADPAAKRNRSAHALAGLDGLPRRFGEYELLELLPAGGMSHVYKARQFHPNRLVAIKIPDCAPLPGLEGFERFQREIEAIAQLQHDHVVRIYECGEEEGLRYFSMEYMDGGSLAAKLHPRVVGQAFQPDASGSQAGKPDLRAGLPLPEREAAQLVQTLARAVQFAHEHGIIHRDLKPANVLLGADGSVKLTDFGLAKWLDGDEELTRSHEVLGTAKYMAPEQARGDVKQIGVRTDVYGLGTILYECLTGRAPFQAATQPAILVLVGSSPPVPPSKLRRGLCRTLEAICLKCLEKDPKQRYASAEELADDLEHWLNHEPTRARPERWPTRLRRTARRHLILTTVVALALLAAVLTPVVAYVRDPARQREGIERILRKGQPVTLIGQTGRPAWFQVRTDPNLTNAGSAEDGSFSVTAFELGLVELLSDPQVERYRFSAEVRQDKGEKRSDRVGIYFAHTQRTTAGGQVMHEFCGLNFDELHPPGPGSKSANSMRFIIRRYAELTKVPIDRTIYGSGWDQLFVRQPHTWRKIAVEVSPERIKAFWENQLVGELSRIELMKLAEDLISEPVALEDLKPDLPARGALGLYVFGATASFRSVVVEPLVGGK